jgi:hypothetical protein
MKHHKFLLLSLLFFLIDFFNAECFAQEQELPLMKIKISVAPEVKDAFQKDGRILLHLNRQREKEPRNGAEITIGITPQNWDGSQPFVFESNNKDLLSSGMDKLTGKNQEKFYYQVVYKQNIDDGNENVAGNLYSKVDSLILAKEVGLNLTLVTLIPPQEVSKHEFVKTVTIQSKSLTEFFGRPRNLKAAILLPATFFKNPDKSYPICYRAPGLNGRFTNINNTLKDKKFMDWWFSETAPQVVYVFLDSQGPYGDTYQVDSENNGPCGKALTEELIPEIEILVHYKPDSKTRFLTGYSTGGWVAMGLQVFYPDFFDGTWSYSPDPIDFEHYGLISIYQDSTIFYNRWGYLQPGRRTIYGEPTYSMKEWIANENLGSRTNDYRVSGGQFGAYNAVFGPRGKDGLPTLMFDPLTGKIDHTIAKQWEKYDLKKVLEKNWSTLGPKLQGKIWIWTGDMDGLYSNVATRYFKMFIDKTENPKSDAKINFTPMAGHCQEWSDQAVITMIGEKLKK